MQKEVIEIIVKSDEAVNSTVKLKEAVKDVKKETNLVKEASDSLGEKLDNMTGGAISGFKNFVTGIGASIKSMGILKAAIISTGIGALLVVIGSLVAYFTQTERGAEKIQKAFAGIGAVVKVLIDRVANFGEGLFLIFSGKYQEGANKLKNSFKDLGTEMKKEGKQAMQLADDLEALEDREIALIQVNKKRQSAIESLRLTVEQEGLSNKKKADALREAIKLQKLITDDEISIAKERARISQAQLNMGEATDEQRRANAETQSRVIELEGERDRSLRRVTSRLSSFTKETKESTKAVDENAEALKKSRIELISIEQKLVKDVEDLYANTEEKKLSLQKDREQKSLDSLKLSEEEKRLAQIALNDKYDILEAELETRKQDAIFAILNQNKEKAELTKAEELTKKESEVLLELEKLNASEAEKQKVRDYYNGLRSKSETETKEQEVLAEKLLQKQKIAIIGQTFGAISDILGKNSKAGKAAAIAQATINTYQGISEVWATKSTLPEPFATISRIASTATVLASGLSAVRQIKSTKLPQGDVGGGASPTVQAPTVQAPSFNIVGSSGTNQLASAIGSQSKEPLKAYVVSAEVTTSQALDRNIISGASLG